MLASRALPYGETDVPLLRRNLQRDRGCFFADFSTGHISITLAVIALVVSCINAVTGITNFVLNRVRLLKVRDIRAYSLQDGSRHFEVDILSYGAGVWDL